MPTVLPASSEPTNFDFSHWPGAIEAAASGIRRSSASSTANVCSTAETTLPVGEFRTRTPRAEAAGTSTLSTPTPARPTTVSFGAAAKSAASTFVALRTSSASASSSAARSSSRETPGEVDDLVAGLAQQVEAGRRDLLGDDDAAHAAPRRALVERREQRLERREVHVAHVADPEGRGLPLAVAAADREPALLDLRDEGLRRTRRAAASGTRRSTSARPRAGRTCGRARRPRPRRDAAARRGAPSGPRSSRRGCGRAARRARRGAASRACRASGSSRRRPRPPERRR